MHPRIYLLVLAALFAACSSEPLPFNGAKSVEPIAIASKCPWKEEWVIQPVMLYPNHIDSVNPQPTFNSTRKAVLPLSCKVAPSPMNWDSAPTLLK